MKQRYAIASVNWLPEEQGGIRQPMVDHAFIPAAFRGDTSGNWWTLVVAFNGPIRAGETVMVPIAPLIEEAAPRLLCKGEVFELKEGPRTIAIGEVVKVGRLEPREGEPPLDALRRVACSGRDRPVHREPTVT